MPKANILPFPTALAGAFGGLIGHVLVASYRHTFHQIDWRQLALNMVITALVLWGILSLATRWRTSTPDG